MRYYLALTLLTLASHLSAQDISNINYGEVDAKRVIVGILGYKFDEDNNLSNKWQSAIEYSVYNSLKKAHKIHVLPEIDSSLQSFGIKHGADADLNQAKLIGKEVKAQYIIVGKYNYDKSIWKITTEIVEVESGNVIKKTSESSSWFTVQQDVIDNILESLNIKPSHTELEQMQVTWSCPPELLLKYCSALAPLYTGDLKLAENNLILITEQYPTFQDAYSMLGSLYIKSGDLKSSLSLAKRGASMGLDSAYAHKMYALALASANSYGVAESELKEALRVDQDDPETLLYLGDICIHNNDLEAAINFYQKAIQANPQGRYVNVLNSKINFWFPRQFPVYITNAEPEQFSELSLQSKLNTIFTNDKFNLPENPITTNSSMSDYARQVTKSGTNELEKARLLFNNIAELIKNKSPLVNLVDSTAAQVFSHIKQPEINLRCQQLTYLYVALARSLSFHAYCVSVEEAVDGNRGQHFCAAIFINGKGILVDPSYSWFGVPHKRFKILDDLQTIALHIADTKNLKYLEFASKLAPDLASIQYGLCYKYITLNRWDDATNIAASVWSLDDSGILTHSLKAMFLVHQGKLDQAIDLLQEALRLDEQDFLLWAQLGDTYFKLGDYVSARKSYEESCRVIHTADDESLIRLNVSKINDMAIQRYQNGFDAEQHGNIEQALIEYDRSIALNPSNDQAYCGRGDIKRLKQDFSAALSDYDKAIELRGNFYQAFNNRGYVKEVQGDLYGALSDYLQVVALQPNFAQHIAIGLNRLGALFFVQNDLTNAIRCFTNSSVLNAVNNNAVGLLWFMNSLIGDHDEALANFKSYDNKINAGFTNEWITNIESFISGAMTDSELLQLATNTNIMGRERADLEACFFIASKYLVDGNKELAKIYYEKCLVANYKDTAEYIIAAYESQRL